jgi:hypothetical protein
VSALDDILAKYPDDEVSAALPVIYIAGVAAPLEELSPRLQQKITQAMNVLGIATASTAEEIAQAIAVYCVKRQVNPALLLEVASTYQQGRTADILRSAAGHADEAMKLVAAETVKNAPAERVLAPPPVKAKRGLKK